MLKSEIVHEPPNKLYKTLVTKEEVGQRQGIANPRNLKQLHNVKYLQDAKLKLGNDDIANLYELTMHLGGYVKIIDLWPKDLLKELNKLLDINNAEVVLSYDTTFNLRFSSFLQAYDVQDEQTCNIADYSTRFHDS